MAIDIRAEVSCSLGTLISGSFADDYLQGNGLIKTRGEVVLDGTQTPVVGTEVTFTYDKGAHTYTIPRVLRVLSSFADPFRRTTTVQLGCKLTYLENRKPPVTDPNAKDEHSDVPCKVFLKAMLPISADYVFQQCLDALELNSAGIPLTNKFSLEEFDLTPGFIQVMSDLLQSEGYVGYLDSEETLQFLDLSDETATGPLITPADVVDLGPIGVGDLPGESVVVRFSSLRLLPPDELYGDDYLKRSWEMEEIFGAETEVTVSYQNDEGATVSDSDVFYPYTFTATRYDKWDRKIESVTLTLASSAEVNNRWASDAFKMGQLWNLPTARITHEEVDYVMAGVAANNVDLMQISGIGGSVTNLKGALASAAVSHTGLANLCKEQPPEGYDKVRAQTTSSYFSELELAGSLNIDSYISTPANGGTGTLVDFDTVAWELDSQVVVEYDTDDSSGLSKTITKRHVSRSQTVSGQQDLATKAQELDYTDLVNGISSLLAKARPQIYAGAETVLHSQQQYGLQKRPSEAERNNTANEKPVVTEQKAEIAWVTGSTTSTAVTEFSVPYAPDDEITWNESTGAFNSLPSDAKEKALRYGRIQNKLLLGNRSGVSLQLAPEQLPKRPFDPIYLQAAGITGAYRVNGTSWAFDANGIVASTDALLWGAVSAASGTNLASSWVPLAQGTTSLPLPYTPSAGGYDSETGVTFSAVITPTTVLPPYIESVLVEGVSRSSAAITDYPYGLNRGSEALVLRTRAGLLAGSRLEAAVGAWTLTGQSAGLTYRRGIAGGAGSVVLNGYGAGSVRDYRIGTNYGTFMATGQNAIVALQRAPLAAGAGSFALSGQTAQFSGATQFPADAGSFAVTGQAAGGIRTYVMSGALGSLSLTGQSANLGQPDPYFGNVVLLLHMNGTNGSTSFVDSSSSAKTVTAYGGAAISTAQSKFGGSSGAFDGANTYLLVDDSTDWYLGAGEFTIEAFIRLTAQATTATIAAQRGTDSNNHAWSFTASTTGGGQLQFRYTSNGSSVVVRNPTWVPSLNTWYHVCACRAAGNLRLFVDGVVINSGANGVDIFNSPKPLMIGAGNNNTTTTVPINHLNGHIQDLRITKGVGRYAANFTVPTQPFPNF